VEFYEIEADHMPVAHTKVSGTQTIMKLTNKCFFLAHTSYDGILQEMIAEEPINMIQLIHYPKCTTCKKAQKWLNDNGVSYEEVHIVEQAPTKEQIKSYWQASGQPLKKFFNTSGMKYRELGLKDKLAEMSEDEQLTLLASDGMLIKRPIVTDGKKVTLGFKESDFEQAWK